MAKQTGLGCALYVGGFDVGGDTQTFTVHGGPTPLDFTDITQSGMARLGGLRDAAVDWVSFMDPAAGASHAALSGLPLADSIATVFIGPLAIGSPALSQVSKQIGYDPTRANDGMLTFALNDQANGFAQEWGLQLTAGKRTDSAATNGASFDDGAGFAPPAVPASGTPVTNTSPLPATVVVSGGTGTNVTINGVAQGTFNGTYTVPAGQTISLTYTVAPTWTWTLQTAFGAQAYLQVFAFTGTDATVTIQDSADNATFANVAGLSFAQVTAAPQAQRIFISNTSTLRRYVRAITTTTGGFTTVTFAVAYMRNLVAGVTF